MCDTGVAMKTPTTDDRITTSRFVARFGGRFLCRSPPGDGGGPPPKTEAAKGAGPGLVHGGEVASRRLAKKSRWRGMVRHALALLFCLTVVLMVLADPLAATVLAAGMRLQRPRAEKAAVTMTTAAAVVSERNTP